MAKNKKERTLDQRMEELERECFESPSICIDRITDCELRIEEVNERISPVIARLDDLESVTHRDLVIFNEMKNDLKSYLNRLEHLEKKTEYSLHYTNEVKEQLKEVDAGVTTKIMSFIFIATVISWGVNIVIRCYW